jgi:hypothetical protein
VAVDDPIGWAPMCFRDRGPGRTPIFIVGANRGSAGRGGISHMVRLISLNTTLLISYSSHNVDMQRAGMRPELEQCLPIKSNEADLWPLNGCGTLAESSSTMSSPLEMFQYACGWTWKAHYYQEFGISSRH